MVGATVFAWTPTLLATTVPFGIGALEFAAISTVTASLTVFVLVATLLWCAGVAAYGNLWFHARHGFAIYRYSYRVFRRYVRFGFATSVVSALVDRAILIMGPESAGRLEVPVTSLVLAPCGVLSLHSIWDWNAVLRRLDSGPTPDRRVNR